MKPLPGIDQTYQLLVQEEKQRYLSAMTQVNHNGVAFNTGEMITPLWQFSTGPFLATNLSQLAPQKPPIIVLLDNKLILALLLLLFLRMALLDS